MTPQYVTDGGMETDLIFHHGADLPLFAAFPLVSDAAGRALLERYYDGYAQIARQASAGLMLETATWRGNPDWAQRLGYDARALTELNIAAVRLVQDLRDRYGIADTVVSGTIGPRGDGYDPASKMQAAEAAEYHTAQMNAFAAAGVQRVTALTMTHTGEAAGVVLAAREHGLPAAVSFTVETDGRLPDGTTLADAVTTVDAIAAPDYYLVNCAHPTHIAGGVTDGAWRERIHGVRPNASTLSHAELDEAEQLDEGDPQALAAAHRRLAAFLPNLRIVGGCCGTDARHVAALWGV